MNSLVVGCHPYPQSLTLAISKRITRLLIEKAVAVAGHASRVWHVDLYRDRFDPILTLTELQRHWSFDDDTQRYIQQLRHSNVIIIVHPVWWGGMPAMLAGWIQRVWKHEVAFLYEGAEFAPKTPRGLLAEKRVLIVYITDSPANDPSCMAIEAQWRYLFSFCAIGKGMFEPIHHVRALRVGERHAAIARICSRVASLTETG